MTDEIKDIKVASIDFSYDGLTGTPKFKVNRTDEKFFDPVYIYALAAIEILETHQEEVLEKMGELVDHNQTSFNVH